jgi:hypothetical protein
VENAERRELQVNGIHPTGGATATDRLRVRVEHERDRPVRIGAPIRTWWKGPLIGSSVPPSPFSIVGPEIAPTQPLGVWPTPVIVTGTDALLWICTVTT